MLLLDVVAAGVQYRGIIDDRLNAADAFCNSVRILLQSDLTGSRLRVAIQIQKLAAVSGAEGFVVLDDGKVLFEQYGSSSPGLKHLARRVAREHLPRPAIDGRLWWIFFPGAARVHFSVPVSAKGGVVAASFSLLPGFSRVVAGQRFLLLYLIANLFLFLFISNFRIERMLFKPLRSLVSRAEAIGVEGELSFAPGQKNSEFNRLSRSLNVMLRRLNADREKLARTVLSLEEANDSLRRAQRDVVRAEKLAAVGRLSAGIAHEIGNPVGIISGYLDLLRQDDISVEKRDDFISRAMDETERINRIVRQLLDFSRDKGEEEKVFSINDIIDRTLEICRSQPLTGRAEISFASRAARDLVFGVPDLIEQVVLNLVINSVDAIRDSGRSAEEGVIRINTEDRDGRLLLYVDDNGPGIPASDLDKLFDPFFTTKEPGSGTGLGLFIAWSVIERMNGGIKVGNNIGGGARFIIDLPLAETGE